MRLKTVISSLFFLLIVIGAEASTQPSYDELKVKAQRFFNNKEWASAEAMIQLMNEERPTVSTDYASGIVAAGMRGDSIAQLRFFNKALNEHVSFDSLFNNVEKVSFSIGSTSLYEKFLLMIPTHYAWLKRNVDARLLNYYAYRRDGQGMVTYAKVMLAGLPDDVGFTMLLAKGYMQLGDYSEAMKCYEQIVENHPDNFDSLVSLGLYYLETGNQERARSYLMRAYEINPTPYIEKLLDIKKTEARK